MLSPNGKLLPDEEETIRREASILQIEGALKFELVTEQFMIDKGWRDHPAMMQTHDDGSHTIYYLKTAQDDDFYHECCHAKLNELGFKKEIEQKMEGFAKCTESDLACLDDEKMAKIIVAETYAQYLFFSKFKEIFNEIKGNLKSNFHITDRINEDFKRYGLWGIAIISYNKVAYDWVKEEFDDTFIKKIIKKTEMGSIKVQAYKEFLEVLNRLPRINPQKNFDVSKINAISNAITNLFRIKRSIQTKYEKKIESRKKHTSLKKYFKIGLFVLGIFFIAFGLFRIYIAGSGITHNIEGLGINETPKLIFVDGAFFFKPTLISKINYNFTTFDVFAVQNPYKVSISIEIPDPEVMYLIAVVIVPPTFNITFVDHTNVQNFVDEAVAHNIAFESLPSKRVDFNRTMLPRAEEDITFLTLIDLKNGSLIKSMDNTRGILHIYSYADKLQVDINRLTIANIKTQSRSSDIIEGLTWFLTGWPLVVLLFPKSWRGDQN